MGALATCTVTRSGNQVKAEEDASRLGLQLDLSTKWTGTFNGTILAFSGQIHAYVVKDTAKTLHLVKLSEISNVEPQVI